MRIETKKEREAQVWLDWAKEVVLPWYSEATRQHCLRVARSVSRFSKAHEVVGLLHDSVEDKILPTAGLDGLVWMPDWLKESLFDLTRVKGEPYRGYIQRIQSSTSPYSRDVKVADLFDNLFNRPSPPAEGLTYRYVSSLHFLRQKGGDMSQSKSKLGIAIEGLKAIRDAAGQRLQEDLCAARFGEQAQDVLNAIEAVEKKENVR